MSVYSGNKYSRALGCCFLSAIPKWQPRSLGHLPLQVYRLVWLLLSVACRYAVAELQACPEEIVVPEAESYELLESGELLVHVPFHEN